MCWYRIVLVMHAGSVQRVEAKAGPAAAEAAVPLRPEDLGLPHGAAADAV